MVYEDDLDTDVPVFDSDDLDTDAQFSDEYEEFRTEICSNFSGGISTLNTIVEVVTRSFIERFILPCRTLTAGIIETELLRSTVQAIHTQNAMLKQIGVRQADMLPVPKRLLPSQIAELVIARHRVSIIQMTEHSGNEDSNPIGMYIDDETDDSFGIYTTRESSVEKIIRLYNRELTARDIKDIFSMIRSYAPTKKRTRNRDLIAVGNGIFNYSTEDIVLQGDDETLVFEAKSLSKFTPSLVFVSKSPVCYRSADELKLSRGTPAHPLRHFTQSDDDRYEWDIESWIKELSDDEGVPELLWQTLGAIIRPHVSWNKTAWFYSEKGNNGKGTLAALMRELTGPTGYASIPISDFSKDFMLEPLTRASAIIVDENDVGTFIDKSANFKAIVTNDVILINRKYKDPIAYQFYGFMVQCLNELPRIRDRSGSLYRRQIFIPFNKSFTGKERRYIKDEYLKDPDVLEYVLWRVLSGYKFDDDNNPIQARDELSYYVLDEPEATVEVLDSYKEFNDPVREFWLEFSDQFVWDLLPFGFLWDLYQKWFAYRNPNGKISAYRVFVSDLTAVTNDDSGPFYRPDQDKVRSKGRMDELEPLIASYELTGWMGRPEAKDIEAKCAFIRKDTYRGLLRA